MFYGEYLSKEVLEGFGYRKNKEKVIHTVKYARDVVLLSKEEMVVQRKIDRKIEVEKLYGMEINVEKLR
jgi:hypothetical protein